MRFVPSPSPFALTTLPLDYLIKQFQNAKRLVLALLIAHSTIKNKIDFRMLPTLTHTKL